MEKKTREERKKDERSERWQTRWISEDEMECGVRKLWGDRVSPDVIGELGGVGCGEQQF